MKEYSNIRWTRLTDINISFDYIKDIVRTNYNYEIKEPDLLLFIKNIINYKDVDEVNLLNILEKDLYTKLSIFSIHQYKKNKEVPIIDDITNTVFNAYFKEKNNIDMKNGEYFNGDLDTCFRVTYYNKNDDFAIIKMARIIDKDDNEVLDDGSLVETPITIYDCCKFIIDLDKKLVFMFVNDIKIIDTNISKEITIKKTAFRNLFSNLSTKNIIKYHLNRYLEKFFRSYMKEIKEGNQRKLVSIIEASSVDSIDEERSLIRSVKRDYIHNAKRLDAIENDIDKEGLTISEIESCIDGTIIDLKKEGEIICINNFFDKEVLRNVCEEFFNGYALR